MPAVSHDERGHLDPLPWHVQLGDAIEVLPTMRPESVSLALFSPPYNIGKSYEAALDVDDYIDWLAHLVDLTAMTLTATGALWLNVGYTKVGAARVPIASLLYEHLRRSSLLTLNQQLVWTYGAGVACKHWFSPRHEDLLWLVRDPLDYRFALDRIRDPNVQYLNARKDGRLRNNQDGKNPTSHWPVKKVTSGMGRSSPERLPHPAQMPLAIAERIVLACSDPGDLVLDCCAGTGTTLAAAVMHGRRALGIELNANYCDTARARLRKIDDGNVGR